jgi:hypothetical protein
MSSRKLLSAVALAGALAACQTAGSGGTLTGEYYSAFYQPSLVNYAARQGHMPVAVYGQPFGLNSPAAVASQLHMPGGHVQVPFAATPEAQAGEGTRVVLLFGGGSPPIGGQELCEMRGNMAPAGPAGGKLAVMAAFCSGDGLASEIALQTLRPADPSDPAFRGDMQVLLARLLPTFNPNRDGDCPGPFRGC